MELKKLNAQRIEDIKFVIRESFSREPWNDDWSDEAQFHQYILDLIDQKNSLPLGLYDDGELIGVSLGRLKHWYSGTEYWIDDFAILPKTQGRGYGSEFMKQMESFLKENDVKGIVLFTDQEIPAYNFYQKNGFEEQKQRAFFKKEWE